MPGVVFTTSSGVHARPLADFCLLSMLAFVKQMPRMIDQQRRHHWERYATEELTGRTLGIVGVGRIGSEVGPTRQGDGHGRHRHQAHGGGREAVDLHLDDLYPPSELPADAHAFGVPRPRHAAHDETEKLLGAAELALLPKGAVVINIGRGALIDEPDAHRGATSGDMWAERRSMSSRKSTSGGQPLVGHAQRVGESALGEHESRGECSDHGAVFAGI
jgi:lactate dehydrogenase-like 2-hydroxyacid dehydrogenase